MRNLSFKTILIFLLVAAGVAIAAPKPLRDGIAVESMAGTLIIDEPNDQYFIVFEKDVKDDKGILEAGTPIEVLKSLTLQALLEFEAKDPSAEYIIWGQITQYEKKNFLYPTYFLATVKTRLIVEVAEPNEPNKPGEPNEPNKPTKQKPSINDPDDAFSLPEKIVKKIKARKIIRTEELVTGLDIKQDSILVDRTGFIRRTKNDGFIFVIDGLGRNIDNIFLPLFPNQPLQRVIENQKTKLEQMRFKVAGIVTKFDDTHYLLLQRAERVYSYGNFPR